MFHGFSVYLSFVERQTEHNRTRKMRKWLQIRIKADSVRLITTNN